MMIAKRTALCALSAVLLFSATACTSDGARDINDPLPRKARDATLGLARDFTERMANDANVELKPSEEIVHFYDCVGEHDEVADDGRFYLKYHARADLPRDQHIQIVRKLRKSLKKQGFKDLGGNERPGDERPIIWNFEAEDGGEWYDLDVHSLDGRQGKEPDELQFSVNTTCFLPPGAKQQKF
ncbi:hypothetical protein ACIBAG_22295 [Streptomyces sp. NPDC051243]|uniref:hypothetical protein n=1 Tax=Streptomyces sp. NPDC051243 TaxID=3365646 RepID=UPI0037936B38